MTDGARARLPDLVIVGAPKAATTTLTHWLRQHPQVAFSRAKELSYFDRRYDRGLPWYLAQLPQEPGDRLVAEATPTYLSEPQVAQRVAQDLPAARFVALLREPVSRAWSNYWFFTGLGVEARSWRQALAASTDAPCAEDPVGYLWRGRYAEQLARWDALVGQDRMHVVLLDDLIADPQATYDGICRFAGITAQAVPGPEAVNPTQRPRSRRLQHLLASPSAGALRSRVHAWNAHGGPVPPLPAPDRVALRDRFADAHTALEERLGRPLPPGWGP